MLTFSLPQPLRQAGLLDRWSVLENEMGQKQPPPKLDMGKVSGEGVCMPGSKKPGTTVTLIKCTPTFKI